MTFSTLGRFRRRGNIALFQALICFLSPLLAIFLRGMSFGDMATLFPMVVYVVASAFGGVAALQYVQISAAQTDFMSVVDLKKIFKAALAASIAGVIGTYFATLMQYVPRYVPVIQFFLFSGLLIVASLWRSGSGGVARKPELRSRDPYTAVEHQLLIGCGPLAVYYASLIDELPHLNRKIAGLVSITQAIVGTTMAGRIVLGPLPNIFEILNEFKNHGVMINRIVISASSSVEQRQVVDMLANYCEERGIELSLLSDILTGQDQQSQSNNQSVGAAASSTRSTFNDPQNMVSERPNAYLVSRQRYERVLAILLALLASPLFLVVSVLAYFDVGRPVIFWQRRVGRYGQLVTVHKFRTLPHMSAEGAADVRQPNLIGRFLQLSRLDEIPQIFDICSGQLSFIGPRPLLPHDLPEHTGMREAVLPGITGWAQVHGGKDVSPEEKIALDNWYLRHASWTIDLLILIKTLQVAIRSKEKRDDRVIQSAVEEFRTFGQGYAETPAKDNLNGAAPSGYRDVYAMDVVNNANAA